MKLTQPFDIKDIIFEQDESLSFFYGVCPWCKEILIAYETSGSVIVCENCYEKVRVYK